MASCTAAAAAASQAVHGCAFVSTRPRTGFLPARRYHHGLYRKQRFPKLTATQWLLPCCSSWNDSPDNNNNNNIQDEESSSSGSSDQSPKDQSKDSSSSQTPWWLRLRKIDWFHLLLNRSRGEKLWSVPWTGQTIFQVMFLWFGAFWLVGSWFIPIAAHALGFSKDSLSYRGQALYSLITDIAEGMVGLGILHRCLAEFQPLSGDWFPIKWRGSWYVEACLGCLIFPLVNLLSEINLDLLPFPPPFTASNVEQSIMARDPVATILYAMVVSVCAPVWEEVIFRGFLLPSLTRYFPLWASIVFSAVAFALAHFSLQRLLPLTFLGLVMGIMFVRNRNLLSSILLHSLWNVFVFLDLLR